MEIDLTPLKKSQSHVTQPAHPPNIKILVPCNYHLCLIMCETHKLLDIHENRVCCDAAATIAQLDTLFELYTLDITFYVITNFEITKF